ncbi:hypothetical protein RHMOL_Rhmol09G0182100 [Rhododendron molle]|uniref:Uncharacterized protein n=1 Tax=Rhododendron molle TaxID=49168 RepID=A0ACC0MGD8_RHOML|nr:hypothetical protein RHMOL_Rhmol09G0182100 [Rhododendron molle]
MQEPLSSLAAEYQSGSPILLEKIKLLTEEFAAIRRTRGDGNCFFRSFMFSYLERILESQDQEEVHRITGNVENCRRTLQSLGYADFTFEDFFALFLEQLESVLQGNKESISHDELIQRSRDQSVSDYSEWHITHVSTYVTWTLVRVSCVGACYYVGVGPLKSNMKDTWIPLIGKAKNKIYV